MSDISISICIPSYNRPEELCRLLKSIDYFENVEVIIAEDKSPKRNEIKKVVEDFIEKEKSLDIQYYENKDNLGYDNNLKKLIRVAGNEYIVFMGDDDVFIPGSLLKLATFLSNNRECFYVLKSHLFISSNGEEERFRYYDGNQYFEKGEDTLIKLFRKSVFISGFIIKREGLLDLETSEFDGTLLYQIYLLSEVTLSHNCAYFDEPLTMQWEEGTPFFGSSENEKDLYTPGTVTVENSINFLSGFLKIGSYIDKKYGLNVLPRIKLDMSKYFYPSLAIQRGKGVRVFLKYVKDLNSLGYNASIYYYIYTIGLLFLGKSICDRLIRGLKLVLGKTPQL
ncbi:hypothetical protein BIY24_01720 [Halobacteriovorax marinus]|uniref:glycosyltransferase family 2 protein n=1 Tax=Halobacteriovorax marinus TaxID=97084 RepID=UPI000BC31FF8|nr:glycosyltransferase family 2 protein [Halobacteriovorax marinus]ATH06700.1 hypothetical protein BIY24_01720 [Halobacteriovorax marinus]